MALKIYYILRAFKLVSSPVKFIHETYRINAFAADTGYVCVRSCLFVCVCARVYVHARVLIQYMYTYRTNAISKVVNPLSAYTPISRIKYIYTSVYALPCIIFMMPFTDVNLFSFEFVFVFFFFLIFYFVLQRALTLKLNYQNQCVRTTCVRRCACHPETPGH